MSQETTDRDDEILARLLADYDQVLAEETPAADFDESLVEFRPELAVEYQNAKHCLELLHKSRRQSQSAQAQDKAFASGAGARTSADVLPQRIGRFLVERELGRGGLGVVYLAHDPKLGRKVALKIPRFEALLSTDLRRRFLREAEAAARLSHPHLVALYEVGEDGPLCYLAAEYCAGPTLAQWLQGRTEPVPFDQVAAVMVDLAEAVQHAHSRGVLHRDIKPSNVLLVTASDSEKANAQSAASDVFAKLTDFGMAKLMEQTDNETRTGALIGTVAYMSPEQAEGRVADLDVRTDVYALGVLLYELTTGAAPYSGTTEINVLRQLVLCEPTAPRNIRPNVPRDLEAITLRCLSKKPADRYATANELAADLRRFLARQPTVARPLKWWQRTGRWARRRPAVAALAAVIVMAAGMLIAGGVTYTMRLRTHAQELSMALAARDEARAAAKERADQTASSYTSDLRTARQAWKDGRIAEARLLLNKHQPQAGEIDHRSFVWGFLARLCDTDQVTLAGHKGPVYVCRYSPDGRLLASGGEDGKLLLWNTALGTLETSWAAHERDIIGLAFSPDGKWLATMSDGQGVAIWDVATRDCAHRIESVEGPNPAVTFTSDSQTLVALSADGAISLLNTSDWSLRVAYATTAEQAPLLAVSPNVALLATTRKNREIHLRAFEDMQTIGTLEGYTNDITAIAFSHDGTRLASSSNDGTVKMWDTATSELYETFDLNTGHVKDVAFTPDDQFVLAAGHRGDTQLCSRLTDKIERVWRSGTVPVYSVAISPGGRQFATTGEDGLVQLWNGPIDAEKIRLVTENRGTVMALPSDGRVIAVGDDVGNLRFYNSSNGELLKQLRICDKAVKWICFSDKGDRLALALDDKDDTVELWSFPGLARLHVLDGHDGRLRTVRFSPDGDRLASCSDDSTVQLWDSVSGAKVWTHRPDDKVRDTAFSPDGKLLAGAARDGAVYVWDLEQGVQVATLNEHRDDVLSLAWSPTENLLVSGAKNGTMCFWDMNELALLNKINSHQGMIESLAFSPDGLTLASGGEQRLIKIWDVASQEELLSLARHSQASIQVLFGPQGNALYSLAPSRPGDPCELLVWPALGSTLVRP